MGSTPSPGTFKMNKNKFSFLIAASLSAINILALFRPINSNAQKNENSDERYVGQFAGDWREKDLRDEEYRAVKEGVKKIVKGKTTRIEIEKLFGITYVTSDDKNSFGAHIGGIIPDKYSASTENQTILYYEFLSGGPPECPFLRVLFTINKATGVVEDFYTDEGIADCD